MSNELFKVPKNKRQATLWVHPDGQVIGSIFVLAQSSLHAGEEEPIEALNGDAPFIVISLENPEQLRFYNRNSVLRLEYTENTPAATLATAIDCRIQMMDGASITGKIQEALPQNKSRLFDYLNRIEERFIKLYTDEKEICLINKSYINYVTNEE
ncbi:hypothetical protein MNBD_GAMMA24-1033 [hydrothermal vent metagenome]|uniref:Uncharacterized protein n=1 Tax=hydrothermal vent metagenome TaxID=652676 RepID=A0A3B1B915_9ZZZZ